MRNLESQLPAQFWGGLGQNNAHVYVSSLIWYKIKNEVFAPRDEVILEVTSYPSKSAAACSLGKHETALPLAFEQHCL